MDEEHCALYIVIVSDRLYVLGGEAGSYRERGAYQDQDQDQEPCSILERTIRVQSPGSRECAPPG